MLEQKNSDLEAVKTEVEAEIAAIKADSPSFDDLIRQLAGTRVLLRYKEESLEVARSMVATNRIATDKLRMVQLEADTANEHKARLMKFFPKAFEAGLGVSKLKASKRAKAAANALHDKPGGNRDKQEQMRVAWASGKYASRDLCAEQECAALNMAFGTARKALINTPQPPRRCGA